MKLRCKCIYIGISIVFFGVPACTASNTQSDELKVIETKDAIEIHTPAENKSIDEKAKPGSEMSKPLSETAQPNNYKFDPVKYTLGPEDVVEIMVMRHPEFSGTYPINKEGKLQYKFVGDMDVTGLNKQQLEQKIKEVISSFVIAPEVNVTVVEYKSKVFYVLGEVGAPGKYYMQSEAIPVREAVFMAGLPTQAAAMRKCQIITPDKNGHAKIKKVNIYSILYGGNLKRNINMLPGEVLYVPSTVMAKVVRVISPVTTTIGVTAGAPSGVQSGKSSVQDLAK